MLFGHQNDDTSQSAATAPSAPSAGVNPLAVDPATGASLPVAAPVPQSPLTTPPEPSVLNQPTVPVADDTATAPVVEPPMPFPEDTSPLISMPAPPDSEPAPAPTPAEPVETPTVPDLPTATPEETPAPVSTDEPTAAPNTDALLALKQQALTELSPLVDQLDQTPEERFRTTMMMIQSTDNQSLIQSAYDAAEKITDEKVRAQALLDIINEINYFTQQKPAS